ncbi:MAG: hypothetical protein BWY06_03207 [Candidatus Latescibacteria bacterium ADurb.Bin168]|nr:MAG: hypothetical protein BWY06_03207 [Candidatus Latescibacteria bacterium ADurb.Bin168]
MTDRLLMLWLNEPVPEPICVLLSLIVTPLDVLYTTPRFVTDAPPSDVTLPPSVADVAVIELAAVELTDGAEAAADTVPISWKSSSRNVPVPEAPLNVITTVIVPVLSETAFATDVWPIEAPDVPTEPEPTEIPLMVMDQPLAPVLLRWHQKLNAVIDNL